VLRRTVLATCIAIGSFAFAGTAVAAAPVATTLAATGVTATTATLNGNVVRNDEETTYYFEYGKTTAYGTKTAAAGVSGNAPTGKLVSESISGLTPSTTYHFRLVATNPSGTANGADMTFITPAAGAPPAGAISIAASRSILTFGKSVTFTGQVAGSPNEKVTLEESPFPYTDPFKPAAQGTTDAAANYSFTVSPALNTRYHVTAKKPTETSPDVTVLVRTKVGLRLSDKTPRRGARVRFRGSVLPAHDGSEVRIQRKTSSGWKTIRTPVLTAATPINGVARSKYRARIRIRRNGAYRTVMPAHGDHARGKSGKRRARVH